MNQITTAWFSIFLSISFETTTHKEMFSQTIQNIAENNRAPIFISVVDEKTPQMQHIRNASTRISAEMNPETETWVLFCDDDDTYAPNRIQRFSEKIQECNALLPANDRRLFAGVYESTFGKTHKEQWHEYWCYCVHHSILTRFFALAAPTPEIIQHKCGDIVLCEYLRRITHGLFAEIKEPMYNYRRHDNAESVTGTIMGGAATIWKAAPPPPSDISVVDYLLKWNDYLHNHLEYYMHDTFLRTITGREIDHILASEFCADYAYIDYIDQCHVDKIKEYYSRIRAICAKIYETPI
jgi:hypothetical protein